MPDPISLCLHPGRTHWGIMSIARCSPIHLRTPPFIMFKYVQESRDREKTCPDLYFLSTLWTTQRLEALNVVTTNWALYFMERQVVEHTSIPSKLCVTGRLIALYNSTGRYILCWCAWFTRRGSIALPTSDVAWHIAITISLFGDATCCECTCQTSESTVVCLGSIQIWCLHFLASHHNRRPLWPLSLFHCLRRTNSDEQTDLLR